MAREDVAIAGLRSALAGSFAGLLGEQHVEPALSLWDRRYANGKPYALIEYVNELSAALQLPNRQRHELRMALYRALLARGIDPTRQTSPSATRAETDTTPTPRIEINGGDAQPAFRIFRHVALVILQGVRADHLGAADIFEAALRQYAKSHGVDDSGRDALIRWAGGDDAGGYFQRVAGERLPSLAHLLYVASCEALGPVAADRLMSRAIHGAEALPEAVVYPPQRLL